MEYLLLRKGWFLIRKVDNCCWLRRNGELSILCMCESSIMNDWLGLWLQRKGGKNHDSDRYEIRSKLITLIMAIITFLFWFFLFSFFFLYQMLILLPSNNKQQIKGNSFLCLLFYQILHSVTRKGIWNNILENGWKACWEFLLYIQG